MPSYSYEIGNPVLTSRPKYLIEPRKYISKGTPGTIVDIGEKGVFGLYQNYVVEFNMQGETFTTTLAQEELLTLVREA